MFKVFKKEIDSLREVLGSSRNQTLAIIGGAKVSTKLEVIQNLGQICDKVITGGGITNTFLAAKAKAILAEVKSSSSLIIRHSA